MNNSENAIFNSDPVVLLEQQMREINPAMHFAGDNPEVWQKGLKSKISELTGLSRKPVEKCDLHVRSLWKRDHEYGTIEKIVFTSEPGYDVPAYVCIPHGAVAPMPFFVCLQGHSTGMHVSIAVEQEDEITPKFDDGDRDFGLNAMRYGVAAVCIEQRAFGECEDRRGGVNRCHNPSALAMMMGRTLLGDRIYDIDRAIDYILSRGDADPARIGVMGNSGGGTASLFSGGLLDRITHVMPSCGFCSFKDSIMSIDHCICNYVPQLLLWAESSDVAGLAAPKPMVIVSGIEDPIFPIKPAKEQFAQLKNIYRAFGAEERCHHVLGNGGHRFYADEAWPVMLKELNK